MMHIRISKALSQSKRCLNFLANGIGALALVSCGGGASGQTGPSTPKPAGPVSDGISYSASGKKLDFCDVPSGIEGRSVAIIFIHGGGFRTGNRSQMKGFCELFAKGGFHSVTIDYRLSGEATYPAAVEDVNDAIFWMRRESRAEGFSESKIVLVGYSAGGSLSLMADGGAFAPAARVSVAGISDFEAAIKETPHAQLRRDLQAFLGDTDPASISPINTADKNFAPTFFFHGKQDNLVPVVQSIRMAQKLEANGTKQLLRVYDNAGHEIMLGGPNLKPLLRDLTAFLVAIDAAP